MKEPTPVRYCPVAVRRRVPQGVLNELDAFAEQFKLVPIIERNLCNSCAYGEIQCDPLICEPKLVSALKWAKTADNLYPAFAGSCKKIYRDYARERSVQQTKQALAFRTMARGLLDDD